MANRVCNPVVVTATTGFPFDGARRLWRSVAGKEHLPADPRYVKFFVDTAQHCIADVDPVAVYEKHHERVTGFHFKDTRHKDVNDDYRMFPDAEVSAKTTEKWFYEMGTEEGLVDFEAMMRSVRDNGYTGWISVEHDKADKLGGDYAESTAISRWYAKNVLDGIYNEEVAR